MPSDPRLRGMTAQSLIVNLWWTMPSSSGLTRGSLGTATGGNFRDPPAQPQSNYRSSRSASSSGRLRIAVVLEPPISSKSRCSKTTPNLRLVTATLRHLAPRATSRHPASPCVTPRNRIIARVSLLSNNYSLNKTAPSVAYSKHIVSCW